MNAFQGSMTLKESRSHLHRASLRVRHLVRKRRGASAVVCSFIAALAGTLCVFVLGKNLSVAGHALEGFGHVYRVALPKGVIRLEDVRIFEVMSGGADDFVRAELNGHSVLNSEDPQEAVVQVTTGEREADKEARELVRQYVVNRHTKLLSRRPAQLALVRGWNQLVVEVENYGGPCSGDVQLFVNEQPIAGMPAALPLRPEANDKLLLLPEAHKEHALCARVAYQFELD